MASHLASELSSSFLARSGSLLTPWFWSGINVDIREVTQQPYPPWHHPNSPQALHTSGPPSYQCSLVSFSAARWCRGPWSLDREPRNSPLFPEYWCFLGRPHHLLPVHYNIRGPCSTNATNLATLFLLVPVVLLKWWPSKHATHRQYYPSIDPQIRMLIQIPHARYPIRLYHGGVLF